MFYSIGKQKYLLLKPTIMRSSKDKVKQIGYISFNNAFVEEFIRSLDKMNDLNL